MRVERSRQFKSWVERLSEKAAQGDERSRRMARYVLDELRYIRALTEEPHQDTATLKRVRQSGRHQVWRLSHPYDGDMAVRIICWFPPDERTVVVTPFAADKLPIGDVFYNSVGSRSDQAIQRWIQERRAKRKEKG